MTDRASAPHPSRRAQARDRLRVLHVAHHSQPHVGGLENVVAAQTRGLVDRGHDVTLLTSAWGMGPGTRVEKGVRTVRVRSWDELETRFGVPFPLFAPTLVVAAWREVRRADVVHVHDPLYLTSWAAALACRLTGTTYVVHRHVGFVDHPSRLVRLVQRVVLGTLAQLVLDGAAAVLPIDEFIAGTTRTALADPGRVHVLGNGVDTSVFHPADREQKADLRAELGLPLGVPLALFVGRFVPKKGYAAVAAAASEEYGIVFVGGDRPPSTDDDRLTFLGALPPDEVARVYRAVDVCVVASVGECPLTVLEAMSSGLPVLVNDVPAMRSPWTAAGGVVFVDVAAGELAGALQHLLSAPGRVAELGAQARARVERAFSWEAHLDDLVQVYLSVL